MVDVNVTRLITDADPFEFSSSVAERGKNAGPETWANAKTEATERPLEIDDREGTKRFFAGFGAWERDEIAAWSDAELDALILQYASGDLREMQELCPGDGVGSIDWEEAEQLAHAGTIGGNLWHDDAGQLFIYLGN